MISPNRAQSLTGETQLFLRLIFNLSYNRPVARTAKEDRI